jgi:alpha-L-fucosidase
MRFITMKNCFLFALFITSIASYCSGDVVSVPKDTKLPEESPRQRDARMNWWREARFGMFIHWGLYAIPAGEWKGKPENGAGEWIMNQMHIPPAEYGQLIHQFNPQKFDANKWAAIARDAGMKYIVITSKHHDGFSLFDSKFGDYNVMDTPFKRDIMKELSTATRAAGLQMCWYHSILDWHDPNAQTDETFPKYEQRLRNQVTELLTKYGPIGVMWFDGDWIKQWNDQRGQELYKLCRSVQPSVIVNNRVGHQRSGMNGFTKTGGFTGDYATPEQEIPDKVPPGTDWETCMTMNDTWGFKKNDLNFKSTRTLIRNLVDIASKNGNFLLNVGPTAEGEIPPQSVERLAQIGEWMKVNGEAIYATHGSPFGKLSYGRATVKNGKVYIHVFDMPAKGKLVVPIRTMPTNAVLLANPDEKIEIASGASGVTLTVANPPKDADATVIALDVPAGPVDVINPPASQSASTKNLKK